ncbi:protein of unknown function [Moritella yayanosii]|uniref:Uncharacterized protein n=1 Tax=Moritella yayanosii TaxID=69539 RepID=A0A330LV43_9GAMM|nr:protein of unknown function [Moritella yayanosii]
MIIQGYTLLIFQFFILTDSSLFKLVGVIMGIFAEHNQLCDNRSG